MRLRTTLAALFCGLAAFIARPALHASALRTITDYTLVSANDFPERDPKDWRLLGSNDGKNWTVVDSRTNEFFAERFERRSFTVTNRVAFSTFRLVIDALRQRASSAQIAEIRLNGLIDGNAEVMDVTPGAGDLVTAHGENAPAEGRRRGFDGDPQTKWLDFINDLQSNPLTWIQWEYEAQEAAGGDFMQTLSTVIEVRQKSRILALNTYRVLLDGTIIWASPEQDLIAFQDSSGAALLQLSQPQPGLRAGQRISIRADSELKSEGLAISLARSPVVMNDGIHTAREASGRVYLDKGRHPISLEWFQAEGMQDLSVSYEGPGISKQPIPDAALWHREGAASAISSGVRWERGLEYKAYEGRWSVLPAFSELRAVKRGVSRNFLISMTPRDHEAGLVFSGWINIAEAGLYTFYTSSDDGSRLLIRDPHAALKVRGEGIVPAPRRIEPGQIFASIDENRWVVADGKVTFRGERDSGYDVEITAESGRMHLRIARLDQKFPSYLLNSRIRAEGISRPTYGADRLRRAGEMIVPSLDQIEVVEFPAAAWRNYPLVASDKISARTNEPAHIRGEVRQEGGKLFLHDAAGEIEIEPSQIGFGAFFGRADVLGSPVFKGTNLVLASAVFAPLPDGSEKSTEGLPLLTTVEEIHALSREEAARSYPVKIRGVVTAAWPGVESAIIQDGTRGIFVPDLTVSPSDYPEIGDYMEVEGTTDPGGFAPVINTESVSRLGRGTMPEPQQPTWNQLVNGSMDVQYCELRGLVTSVRDDLVTLLMRGGWIDVQVNGIPRTQIATYEHALIRMRGAIGTSWDEKTHQLTNALIRIERPIISIEQPAPRDIFDTRLRHAADLLLFDPARDDLQRLKVSGQIVHASNGEFFLMDGTNGLRFFPKKRTGLRNGDLVEVVGYPRPAFGAPVLRDAETRVTGHEPLPPAVLLDEESMFLRCNDATRVALEARLASIRSSRADQILELQTGARTVFAMIRGAAGEHELRIPAGATVYVTGAYDGRGSERGDRVELDSFELLCDSPADIKILKRPAWWTSERMIALIGSLAGILLAAVIWIRALRRHVGRQTRALIDEVDERRAAEQAAHRARREAELAREAAEAGNRAKGQFLAAMSHEIRTPMNAIIGMANLLMDSGLNSDQAELARTVSSSGQALLTIMNDILDFSKIEAGKVVLDSTAFDLREVLEATLDLLAEPAQRKGLELTCVIEKDVCTGLKGDPGRLRQILLNLLSNAVKFTDQGEIAVHVSQFSSAADKGKVRLKLTVRDTGIGISPEARQRIFSPFEQADKSTTRKYGGTGLGLAICRPLAELMGGRIELSSQPGQGSEFMLTICLERAAAEPGLPAVTNVAAVRVLLCEPHPSAREMIGGLLSAIGVRAGVNTGNGSALQHELQAAAQSGDPYRVVILDAGTDPEERLALLRQLRTSISTDFKIVLLTPISQRFSGNELLAKGVEVAVAKPVKLGALRDALLKALSAPSPKPAAAKTPPQPELKQARILLAEDNPVNQMVALRQLKKLGYAAEVVSNGAEAVASFERQHFDYILMDCHMPEMDGYEATKRIRELAKRNGRVRIVAMTANAMQGDRERCLEAGMDDYISKPVAIEQLKAALEK